MHADRAAEAYGLAHDLLHLARDADANRVGEDDLVRSGDRQPFREGEHARGIDGALERAPERRSDRDRGADAVSVRALDDPGRDVERLLRRGVLVTAVVGLPFWGGG